jgi:hypothetical protein
MVHEMLVREKGSASEAGPIATAVADAFSGSQASAHSAPISGIAAPVEALRRLHVRASSTQRASPPRALNSLPRAVSAGRTGQLRHDKSSRTHDGRLDSPGLRPPRASESGSAGRSLRPTDSWVYEFPVKYPYSFYAHAKDVKDEDLKKRILAKVYRLTATN